MIANCFFQMNYCFSIKVASEFEAGPNVQTILVLENSRFTVAISSFKCEVCVDGTNREAGEGALRIFR